MVAAVESSVHTIMEAMFELTEFDVPRTFIILPYKLDPDKVQADGKKSTLAAASGSSMDKASKWITKLTSVINVVSNDVAKVRKDAASKVEEMFVAFKSEKMYLYLVDEVSWEPVSGPGYPIVIKAASPEAKKMLPLMTLGLKTLCLTNKLAGLARCFGLPVPMAMPSEMQGVADNFVKSIEQKSSAAGFDVVQCAVDEAFADALNEAKGTEPDIKKLRGAKLREFKDFLEKEDPMRTFAGLSREIEDGKVLWTLGKGSVGFGALRSIKTGVNEDEIEKVSAIPPPPTKEEQEGEEKPGPRQSLKLFKRQASRSSSRSNLKLLKRILSRKSIEEKEECELKKGKGKESS